MVAEEPASKRAKTASPSVKLSSGYDIPMIGLGTWKSKPGEVKAAVEAAIDAGYRHIDCAPVYGNEKEVGEALKNKLGSAVQRSELFITSKLWNSDHKKENVRAGCQKTLDDLGLEYIDLYLIHWPHAFAHGSGLFPKREDGTIIYDEETDYIETWAAMESLVDAGLVRSIGISNFNDEQVARVIDMCRIKPTTNQVECHPYFDQRELKKVCERHGILLSAYCPLGSADNPARKPDWPVLLNEKVLADVGAKYGKTTAQVAIKWQLQRGLVVLPKSTNPDRIKQNLDSDFELSAEDMAVIDSLNRDLRLNQPVITIDGEVKVRDAGHRYYPFRAAKL